MNTDETRIEQYEGESAGIFTSLLGERISLTFRRLSHPRFIRVDPRRHCIVPAQVSKKG